MRLNVNSFIRGYDFEITGVSYIGDPVSNTVMYIGKKLSAMIDMLETAENCLVFIEDGMIVSDYLKKRHAVIPVDNPQYEFAKCAKKLEQIQRKEDSRYRLILKEGGYYVSENARIGEHAYIEPGCIIGTRTIIGNDAVLLAGSIIKNSIIGDHFVSKEYAVTGSDSYTMAKDQDGNRVRIPSMGKVVIGNHVEAGSFNNIARGSVGNTVIEDYVKLDSFVHIGHDAHIKRNAELAAGTVIGGFVEIGESVFLGINSSIRNRICVGSGSIVGMGAAVMKSSLARNMVLAGNPAKVIKVTGEQGNDK